MFITKFFKGSVLAGISYFLSSQFFSNYYPEGFKYHFLFGDYGYKIVWWWLKGKTIDSKFFKQLTKNRQHYIIFDKKCDEYCGPNLFENEEQINSLSNSVIDYSYSEEPDILNEKFLIVSDELKYVCKKHLFHCRYSLSKWCKLATAEPIDKVYLRDYDTYVANKLKIGEIYDILDHPYIKNNIDKVICSPIRNILKYSEHPEKYASIVLKQDPPLFLDCVDNLHKLSDSLWIKLLDKVPYSVLNKCVYSMDMNKLSDYMYCKVIDKVSPYVLCKYITYQKYIKLNDVKKRALRMKVHRNCWMKEIDDYGKIIYHPYDIDFYKRNKDMLYKALDSGEISLNSNLIKGIIDADIDINTWLEMNPHKFKYWYSNFDEWYLDKYISEKAFINLVNEYGSITDITAIPQKFRTRDFYIRRIKFYKQYYDF